VVGLAAAGGTVASLGVAYATGNATAATALGGAVFSLLAVLVDDNTAKDGAKVAVDVLAAVEANGTAASFAPAVTDVVQLVKDVAK
jgi:hypothetical protein